MNKQIFVYAHTHWDREWYRTFERFRMQMVGVIDRVLQTLDQDPAFTAFVLDGQTIVLEDYLAIRPEEEPRLRRLVGAGRLEIGPWYVLPDEFLVSGESLIRNLLEGRRVAARFGKPLAVGYLPDPFGHVAQLPLVLRGFGIDNVIFSRGMGDEFTRTGSEFRWQALDGTDVLALVQSSPYTNGYCNFELAGRGNSAHDEASYEAAKQLESYLSQSSKTGVLLFAAGCDHETLQAELPTIVERLKTELDNEAVRLTGLPAVVQANRTAEKTLKQNGHKLETLSGELRGAYHAPILSSIFSARIPLKQENDRLQALLERHLEPLMAQAVGSGVRPQRDVQPFMRHAWRLVLENHPHDSIGGCSVDAVHEEMQARSLRTHAIAHGLVEDLRIATGLTDEAVVHDSDELGGLVERADGTVAALRPGAVGRLLPVNALELSSGAVVESDRKVSTTEAALSAEVHGELGADAHLILTHQESAVRIDFVDEADAGDEYDFGQITGDQPLLATLKNVESRMAGAAVAELSLAYTIELPEALSSDRAQRSSNTIEHQLTVKVRVSPASPLAHLTVEFANKAADHRLRVRATTMHKAEQVEALGHFATVKRALRPSTPQNKWKQDPPGLDHCLGAVRLINKEQEGVLLLAGRGLHEYEARSSNELELTLLRAVGWLSRDDIKGRPGHAGPALQTPGAQCFGAHKVELAIGASSHSAQFDYARAFLNGPELFEPFGADAAGESGALARKRDVEATVNAQALQNWQELAIKPASSGGAVLSAFKLADDGSGDLILRWWAPQASKDARAELRVDAPIESSSRARLDETVSGPAPIKDGTGSWRVKPGGVLTIRVKLQKT